MNLEKEMRDEIDYKIDGIHPKDAIEVALKYGEFIKNKAIDDIMLIVDEYLPSDIMAEIKQLKEKKQ